ncbi:carbamoyl-phosphate synthase large subunit [Jatrophihabitans endophyticus]|uniref:Carbamoyl-phosphate synthase large subunit n=1 Tax=Jatrophihabitans endophyticus TaxID=1206085 RepID=A0A1M5CHU8_9ACTN|nr:ATP-grasp domain-containing protein [Jatrophihabitans endophyticus]SHF54333.1 carbamoyl-phosphate synthase large subunit [Jatrophihabitans endophyticus]
MTTQSSPSSLGTVLVTGAGGAAAVTLLRSLAGHAELVAADIDPVAVGLYLTDASRRVLLPRGDSPDFVDALLAAAVAHHADLVAPTVDAELLEVSLAADRFAEHGIRVLVESPDTLRTCLDKSTLMQRCAGRVRVPQSLVLDGATTDAELAALGAPFIVKPRSGAGGRGFRVVAGPGELTDADRAGDVLAQELLPGDEYSIDVLCRPGGGVVAAVPRRRDKVDSGIAVAGRTVADPALETFGREVAELIGAQGVVNVQVKLDAEGSAALLEVNARFPGTMALTQAAGIDMPLLAVRAAFGEPLPERLDFREVAVVRHWGDVVVPIDEYGLVPSHDGR